jgi:hypothetical protein
MVGPLSATARLMPTMKRSPPSRASRVSRARRGPVIDAGDDLGRTPASTSPMTMKRASVQDRPATASGENDLSATAVAG